MKFLATLLSADKVGGYVRAGVASGLGLALARWPLLSAYLDPVTQNALGIAAAGLAVGLWSHIAKDVAAS